MECGVSLEHNRQVGRNRKFCGDTCRKQYHYKRTQERKRQERFKPRICPNCGKEFVPMWERGGLPRFCSDECRIVWWREYHKVMPDKEEPSITCAYCGKEMNRQSGKYCGRVCYRLGAAQVRGERRCGWCGKLLPRKARTGQKYCSSSCAASAWQANNREGRRKRCITTRNSGAWRKQLAEQARETDLGFTKDRRIFLVCGATKLTSTDALVNYIQYELACDPFDGSIYLFCSNDRSQLKWLSWDGSGFCVGIRTAEWGRYPWPADQQGTIMEITEQEHAFLTSKSICTEMPENG